MGAAARPPEAAAASGSLKRELGATLALGWPIILANVAIYAMTATDFIMLGRLSPRALAAGALGFNLFQPAMVLGIGIVAALSPIAAAKIGAGESGEALRRATHQSLLSAVALSLVTWIYLWQTEPILLAIGEPADLARDAGTYMRGYQWSLLPNLLFITARCIFSALERPRPTLIAGLVAVAFNALANYALVFGKLGMPALGIIGSGIATTLSQSLMFLILLGASFVGAATAAASTIRPALAPGAARPLRAVAAWPADGRDDPRRSRRVLRCDDGDGPDRTNGARSAYRRLADRVDRLHGPARLGSSRDGSGRPCLRRAQRPGDCACGLVRLRPHAPLCRLVSDRDDRRATALDRALHRRRRARECERRRGRRRACSRSRRSSRSSMRVSASSPTCCAGCTIRNGRSSLRFSAIGRSARRSALRWAS